MQLRQVRSGSNDHASYACYNRDVIAAFLAGTCELDVFRKVFDSLGRADLVIKLLDESAQKVYIFELKMLKQGKKPESIVQEAKDQILDRRYSNPKSVTVLPHRPPLPPTPTIF
jgi:hypothetical protein